METNDQPTNDRPCGYKAFDGMMPPCVLQYGHEGDHEDGIGGHYTNEPCYFHGNRIIPGSIL